VRLHEPLDVSCQKVLTHIKLEFGRVCRDFQPSTSQLNLSRSHH
jgi:hypothetical protein